MSPILSCLHADRHIPLILHHIPTDSPSSPPLPLPLLSTTATSFHNGSIFRISLPLQHLLFHRTPATGLPDSIHPLVPSPQRQCFSHFAAVAASPFAPNPIHRPSGQHHLSAPFPQRQHFLHFPAVAAPPFAPHPVFSNIQTTLHLSICYCILFVNNCISALYVKIGKTDKAVFRRIPGKKCRICFEATAVNK